MDSFYNITIILSDTNIFLEKKTSPGLFNLIDKLKIKLIMKGTNSVQCGRL